MPAVAEVCVQNVACDVIATRGAAPLFLGRVRDSGRQQMAGAIQGSSRTYHRDRCRRTIRGGRRIHDEDIDTAFAELEPGTSPGRGAYTRSVARHRRGYASINRRELPPATPDWANVDHRRGSFAPVIARFTSRGKSRSSNFKTSYIEAVHQLRALGAVVTQTSHGTSQDGFNAEWRGSALFTVEGDLISRFEVFDEADLDAAIARFDSSATRRRGWRTRQAK